MASSSVAVISSTRGRSDSTPRGVNASCTRRRRRVKAITATLLDAMAAARGRRGGRPAQPVRLPPPGPVDLRAAGRAGRGRGRLPGLDLGALVRGPRPGGNPAGGGAMFGYFTGLLADKRRSPADDLLSALIL